MKIGLGQISISMNGTSGRFGQIILNKYGAPQLSELTKCGAPPMEEPENYIATFVLNSMFIRNNADPTGRLILMFGRRVFNAIREYARARELLLAYVQKLPQTNSHFLDAMIATTHFEQSIASTCQALAFLQRFVILPEQRNFYDDLATRLRKIYNRSKHFDEDLSDNAIENEQISAPVWLTNEGISSKPASVTFDELHSLLAGLLNYFKALAT